MRVEERSSVENKPESRHAAPKNNREGYILELIGDWNYPTRIRFGRGRLAELPDACKELGITIPLLVTDPGIAKLPIALELTGILKRGGVTAEVFCDVTGNPTLDNVKAGVAAYTRSAHDGIIAVGGGSALDAAKAIALMVGQTRPLWDFEDVGDNWTRANAEAIAPLIAVPTTSGTGSEVGRVAVITDVEAQKKRLIFHPNLMPSQVLADPDITEGLPPELTASTGMDALSHNLEAYCAPGFHPMARGIALEGIRLIHKALVRAVRDGHDMEARAMMLAASTMGATAFQRGLGAMHALAHPLGAIHDAHHGTLNAVLMPYVLKTNMPSITTELDQLASALDLPLPGAQSVLDWILGLRTEIGIPHTLSELGITGEDADRVSAMAMDDPSAATNPVPLDRDAYRGLYLNAVHGTL